ncbi:C40 family peptidase [Streptomyces lonarensis]|uniref:NlpC/P60 family protein n=1 Tax=Streptomyces lonarensis TaxID=700599 RepID=A0A7X6D3H7_9ACTN|nr:C40 family peptidase [Streptomyces lonarensis]NJQ07503.1 NlpC/P60 family protein [Streptomyces lonarensis]
MAHPERTGRRRPAHRKPRARSLVVSPARTAAGLTLVGAATVGVLHAPAAADPQPSAAEVRARVAELHHEAEQATERYNGATEAAEEAEKRLERLTDDAARRTAGLNEARGALGADAAARYRSGGLPPTVQLALAADPDSYLSRAAALERSQHRQSGALNRLEAQLDRIEQVRAEAEQEHETLREARTTAKKERAAVLKRTAEAEELLATLTAAERAAALAAEGHGEEPAAGGSPEAPDRRSDGRSDGGERAARTEERPPAPPPAPAGSRAAQAVAFAQGQLGKPYGWGATGPSAFDCSGLTQAAWQAAGVSLPRTSHSQIGAGARVSRDQLSPGDLVFYYPGLTHVGMYVGNGQIIHASRPGTPVRYAPVDSMPFAGAARPG